VAYDAAVPAITRLVGFLLAILGIAAYALTGFASMTALIPAFFGVFFILLALAARSASARRHAMHIAVAVAVLGLLATLGRVVPALGAGQVGRPAVITQLLMAVILAVYVALGIKSFVDARRARA
jgi:hypothetical protein